jgi:WD40 repeat protein
VLLGWSAELGTGDLGEVQAGAFAPDGKTLFTGSRDGAIRAWSLPGDARDPAVMHTMGTAAVGVAREGSTVVVADGLGVARYEVTGDVRRVGSGPPQFAVVRALDDGSVRGVALEGRIAVVSDVVGNTAVERLRARIPSRSAAMSAALTPAGTQMAAGDEIGRITVWSMADYTSVVGIDTGSRQPVRRVVLSDDGRHVAARTTGGIGVWSVASTQLLCTIEGDEQTAFRFLPSGDRIVTGGRDGALHVWNLNGREEYSLLGHVGRVTAVGASPDGRTLVSGGATGEVKFWDLRTGQELLGLRRHSTAVTEIEFAAGGRVLVTAGEGQFAIWDARD